jgi:putative ABC transport system ATP-binding protein
LNTPAIQLNHIYKNYRARTQSVSVLRDLSLTIHAGEFISIIGPSGQGKSTLLNILGCLDEPDRGELWIQGERVNWKSHRQLATIRGKKVAMIFQSFELVNHWTVLENVSMCLRFEGISKSARTLKALTALQKVNLLSHATKMPYELSGGERQRCAIARTLCADPDIILADEPTGNLDPATATSIVGTLENLNQAGKTLIVVTHDHTIARRANRIGTLSNGIIECTVESHVS